MWIPPATAAGLLVLLMLDERADGGPFNDAVAEATGTRVQGGVG